jgi:hypothetical protein
MERRDARDAVVMDEVGVRRLAGPRGPESVDWLDLRAVRIRRTPGARGPQDVEFVFHGAGSVCAVPLRLAPEELIERLQQLPGFDNLSLIEALSTPGAADFVCWRPRETALLTRSA